MQKLKNSTKLENKLELTDEFNNVSILFADIKGKFFIKKDNFQIQNYIEIFLNIYKGFTDYSNMHKENPQEVVSMLRKLFENFDKLCIKYKVYKLYTIGDCYVVFSFTNAS
jgi:hypothetical protein